MSKYNQFTQDTSWSTEPTKDGDVKVMCGPMVVAVVPHSPGMFRPEARANAELIKHAPNMHKALTEALRIASDDYGEVFNGDLNARETAIVEWKQFTKQLLKELD